VNNQQRLWHGKKADQGGQLAWYVAQEHGHQKVNKRHGMWRKWPSEGKP